MLKEMKKLTALIFVFVLFSFYFIQNVTAAQFSQSFIRLDSNQANASLSGTVCASPSSSGAGTEENIVIVFPSDFTINSNLTNFTTSTTNLPNGSTAWPGIGVSATSINNTSVEISSSDLTNGSALYCFNFDASGSTTGAFGEKPGNLTTRNLSNTTIDSSNFGLNIISNDQITVSAKVPGAPDDFTVSLNKLTKGNNFVSGNTIEYEITYGSLIDVPFPIIIEATWSQGTIEGDNAPSIDVVSYLTGSATNAYGSTSPIIDTVNRRITWTISSFPAQLTNQKVFFTLRVNDDYSPDVESYFNLNTRLNLPNASTSYESLRSFIIPKTEESTTDEQKTKADSLITSVNIVSISSNSTTTSINTSDFTNIDFYYGLSKDSLTNKISSKNSTNHLFELNNLQINTNYYFRFYVTDNSGNRVTSDIFTFKTARSAEKALADPETLVATSNNTIISNITQGGNNTLVIPTDLDFQIKFAMKDRSSANNIQAVLITQDVLGINNFPSKAFASANASNLIETLSGIYSGNLQTNPLPGRYALITRISDKNGNITEQVLAEVKVVNKFTVVEKDSRLPIEGARVFLYFYKPSQKTYQEIPSSSLEGGNPLYTDNSGQLNLVLPQGRYKAEVTDLRYGKKIVEFEIGPKINQQYPFVEMELSDITFLGFFNYYKTVISDVFVRNTKEYSENLTGSQRFFDLVSLATLAGFVLLTFFAFSRRHHIPLTHMPSYFYYLIDRRDRGENYIHGVIFDSNENPIPSANVYLMDKENEEIISHKKTNKRGEFIFRNKKGKYLIMAMAKHHKTSPVFEYHHKNHLKFKISLEEEKEGLNLYEKLIHYASTLTGMSFEVLLIGSFIFEILFLSTFGVLKTLPFLMLSAINLLIWILHLHNKSHT